MRKFKISAATCWGRVVVRCLTFSPTHLEPDIPGLFMMFHCSIEGLHVTRVGRSCGFSLEHSLSGTCKVLDLKREKPLQGSRSLESQGTESSGFLADFSSFLSQLSNFL